MARKTYIKAINEALSEEMKRDPSVLLMGEDVQLGVFAGTRGLHAEFGGRRVRDTPISELAVAGAAVGAAATGLRPVVDLMFGTFLYLAFDQIANQAGLMRFMFGGQTTVPVVYMTQNGGGVSAGAHHSQPVHQFFMNMPLIKVVVPATPYDVKGLLKAAIRDDNPVVFLNQLSLGGQRGEVPDEEYIVPLGRADIKRQGRDVTICAAGLTVHRSLAAAETLARDGIEAEVIDLRTLKPWDVETVLQSVKRTGRFVAVDEAFPVCSAASEWAATVAEKGFGDLVAPTQRVANKPVPIPFNPALESKVLPGVEDIVEAVNRVVSWKGGTDLARMKLLMPKFGMTMTEGTIAEQFKNPGDRVAAGDEILSVETEKVVTAIEAPVDGTIVKILCRQGDDVPVGDVIAIIET